jgi:hypothetical protein
MLMQDVCGKLSPDHVYVDTSCLELARIDAWAQ